MYTHLSQAIFALVSLTFLFTSTALTAQEGDDLPRLRGEFVLAHGNFLGYVPPQVGDSIYIDFNKVVEDERMGMLVSFSARGESYIPLYSPVSQVTDTMFSGSGVRLIAGEESEGFSVMIDILPYESRADVWIVSTSPFIHSVALIRCEILPDSVEIEGKDIFGSLEERLVEGGVEKSDSTTVDQIRSIAQDLQSEANSMQVVGRRLTPEESTRIDQLLEVVDHLEQAAERLVDDE